MTNAIGALGAILFPGLLTAVVWWDVRQFRIPNVLNGAIAGLFIVSAAAGTFPKDDALWHAGAGILAFCAGMIVYFKGWAGGGDSKLFGALVLWTGWTADSLRLILVMAVAGGVISLVVWWSARRKASGDGTPGSHRPKVPYGVALAVAGFDFWFRMLFPAILT